MDQWILGIVIILAHLLALFLIWRQARVLGWSEEKVIDLVLLVTFFGLSSGRLWYVFENWSLFAPSWTRIILVVKYPGFSILGASLGAIITLAGLARIKKLEILPSLDLFVLPGIAGVLTVLFACFRVSCPMVETARLPQVVVILAVGLILLSRLRKAILDSPRFSKLRRVHGLIFLIGISLTQVGGLLLVKTEDISLYSFYKVLFAAELAALVIWYNEIWRMFKLPSSVLGQIRDYLEQKRRGTEARLAQLRHEDPTRDADRLHQEASDDDTATDKAKHERTQALQFQLTKTLVEVRKALSKIKVGSYGMCEVCGKMIDTDRLAANPQATLCLEHERLKEKKK